MWGRFGSPTRRAESGTEEEFNRALSRWKDSPERIRIMFYFKNADIPFNEIEPEQIAKVKAFKERISSEGVYGEFQDAEEFRTKARMHLTRVIQDWRKKAPSDPETAKATTTPTAPLAASESTNTTAASESAAILTNLLAVSEDDDDGIIELEERAIDTMEVMSDIAEKISGTITYLGTKTKEHADEINQLVADGAQLDRKVAKRIANNTADDFEEYVQRISFEIPRFHKHHSIVIETLEKMAMIFESDMNDTPEDIEEAIEGLQEYRRSLATASDGLSEMRETIARLPRMTTKFNRARRRTTAVTDDLLQQFRIAGSQLDDVGELLTHLIGGR